MLAIASLIFAVIPIVVYVWGIWVMDRYDREPVGLLALNFLWGAIGAVAFGIVFSILTSAALGTSEFLDTIIVAPVVEETVKGVFLFWTVRDRRFDNITDGVVYGMAIGLGFGMTENFLYFLNAQTPDEWVLLVVVRTLFSAVMHALSTGLLGAVFGLTKFRYRAVRVPILLAGLLVAIAIHFTWNYSVSINDALGAGLGMLFIVASLFGIIVLIQISLHFENRLIVRELTEESNAGLIPATHLHYIPYSSKRKFVGWLSPIVDRKRYIQLSTRLAFRKSQIRHCSGREQEAYAAEIECLRADIATILHADKESAASRLY